MAALPEFGDEKDRVLERASGEHTYWPPTSRTTRTSAPASSIA